MIICAASARIGSHLYNRVHPRWPGGLQREGHHQEVGTQETRNKCRNFAGRLIFFISNDLILLLQKLLNVCSPYRSSCI